MPEILKVDSPKNKPFWEDFKKLKDLRNAIIHQKQSKTSPDEIDSKFFEVILQESIFKKIAAGFDVIQFACNI